VPSPPQSGQVITLSLAVVGSQTSALPARTKRPGLPSMVQAAPSAAAEYGYAPGGGLLLTEPGGTLAFAQGMRQNDISEQMRTIARQLTPEEMHAVAVFYGVEAAAVRTTQK
jgi:hypothetical protein